MADAAAVVPMGETKKPSAPTIVDKSLSLAKDKIKKKIQGHESVQVLTEEGGLLSEVQKVVQANVAGGTPFKASPPTASSPMMHSHARALALLFRCSTSASSPSE